MMTSIMTKSKYNKELDFSLGGRAKTSPNINPHIDEASERVAVAAAREVANAKMFHLTDFLVPRNFATQV